MLTYKLDKGKASGLDDIDIGYSNPTDRSLPLQIMFTNSLEQGRLPVVLKKFNIVLIYKKGNRKENYRPVSLTSVICKLQEF